MNNTEKILLVDDELRVLLGMHRTLRTEFAIDVAAGPEDGFRALTSRGPFAVIVSDLKMPMLDGIQFLKQVKEFYPETVRIMLTGQADLDSAIAAMNEGDVFRFLTKPCPNPVLVQALEAALEQHRLIAAEREVLRETVMGTVTLLAEILSVACPAEFSRSRSISRYVKLLALALGLQNVWQIEVAGLLSQIGCVTAASDAGAKSSAEFSQAPACHPAAGARLLNRIKRLETSAQMIALQQKPYREYAAGPEGVGGHLIAAGGQILHIAVDLDRLITEGASPSEAIAQMRAREGEYRPELLPALDGLGDALLVWEDVGCPA